MSAKISEWPKLHFAQWKDTCATLHMWSQIVGKLRLVQSPRVNHWWNVTLRVTPRGLTTGPIPHNERSFQVDFDFIEQQLVILVDDGAVRKLALKQQSVADFYEELMSELDTLGLSIKIYATPVEVPDPIPFLKDHLHTIYDGAQAERYWRILVNVDRVFEEFRSRFIGKSSPVHFFWGSFDLAVTRFSGRPAPERQNADLITREAYSHEVISHGFWPGGGGVDDAAFYAYAAPEPPGLKTAVIKPAAANYNQNMSEFILMYEDVRKAENPAQFLMDFLQSSYDVAANLAQWDRSLLER